MMKSMQITQNKRDMRKSHKMKLNHFVTVNFTVKKIKTTKDKLLL